MLKTKWIYSIPLMAVFLLGATTKTCSSGPRPQAQPPIPPIAACDGTPGNCLVEVVNNCPYPVYIFDTNPSTALTYLTNIPGNGGNVYLYSTVNAGQNLVGRALQFAAGYGIEDGMPSSSVTCDQSALVGACQLGWGGQGTLFEFTYDLNSNNSISYDISAVNGYDFPMTVQVNNPTSPTGPGACGPINTATLDVNNCSEYLNLSGIGTCNSASSTCVRQAIYASDFSNIDRGSTDCFAPTPSAGNPITACRSPRTFGVNYRFYFGKQPTPLVPFCPFGESILYTITPESSLTNFTCAGQCNPGPDCPTPPATPECWNHDPSTSYYPFIKNAVGYGVPGTNADASIYAFPLDDGYSTTTYMGDLVNNCSALTPRFVVTIGPLSGQASGNCPTLPPAP